jgi:hypothetical protein
MIRLMADANEEAQPRALPEYGPQLLLEAENEPEA